MNKLNFSSNCSLLKKIKSQNSKKIARLRFYTNHKMFLKKIKKIVKFPDCLNRYALKMIL